MTAQPKFHLCDRCPALIGLRAKRCGPCGDEVRREAHKLHERARHAKKKIMADGRKERSEIV